MSLMKNLSRFKKRLGERFPLITNLYRGMRDQMDIKQEPVKTSWGFSLAGNTSMAQGNFEPLETELVREMLRDVDILVNIGANVGYYCCHALSMGKPVIAFEPIPRNTRYLLKNVKDNGWSDIEIYPIALFNRVGVLEIYGGNTGASVVRGWAGTPESYVTLVPASTLDIVLGNRLQGKKALILVDVEGAERWILEGATQILANNPKPKWVVEITTTEHQPQGVGSNPQFMNTFQIFFQSGYGAFIFDRGKTPVTKEHVELAANGRNPFATHNFLFCGK